MSVHVATILARKGTDVATIAPNALLSEAVRALAERNIGALVVSRDGRTVDGIVSERDIVRRLASSGSDVQRLTVAETMTSAVTTCGPEATADELMATMTNQRVRHIPVVKDGRLAGLISIGDVVKSRIDDLETQAETLQEYVTGSY